MKPIPPCKGCPDRTTGDRTTDCHTSCEKYQAFREAQLAANRKRVEYYSVMSAVKAGYKRIKDVPYYSIHGKNVHHRA